MARALQSRPLLLGFRKRGAQVCHFVHPQKGRLPQRLAEVRPAPIAKDDAISQFPGRVRKLAPKRCVERVAQLHRIARFRGRPARRQKGAVAPPAAPRHGKRLAPARGSVGVEKRKSLKGV